MSFTAWLSLLGICLLGAASPGPSLAVVMRNTLTQGRGAGVATALSHGAGVGLYALASAIGLAALIATEAAIFTALSLAGSAYLLWIGAKALKGRGRFGAQTPSAEAGRRREYLAAVRDGFAIAFLNPKIALFFLALFSQFIPPQPAATDVALLALTATAVDALWYASIALLLGSGPIAEWLERNATGIERLTGALLVVLALSTAVALLD